MGDRQLSLFTKTYLDFLATEPTRSDAFLAHLPGKMIRSSRQGVNGRTRVVCLDPKEQWRGGSSTPNTLDSPNDASVCSLSQVLEKGSIPPQYFLSSTACAGILRRAANRGKTLPPALFAALTAIATSTTPEQTTSSNASGGGNCSGALSVAACLTAKGQRIDFEVETFAVQPAPIAFDSRQECVSSTYMADDYKNGTFEACDTARPLTTSADRTRAAPIVCVTGDITHTLKAEGFDASEDGGGGGGGGGQPIVTAFKSGQSEAAGGIFLTEDFAPTLQAQNNGSTAVPAIQYGMAVRRLMPIECERLQGFPDFYTLIPMGKKMDADGPRYKALGNSWAIPCVFWIGKRIDQQMRGSHGR